MIKLDEILNVKYLSGYEWSPDSKKICYKFNDGGITDAYIVDLETKLSEKITEANSSVSGIKWSKYGLVLVVDGNVCVYKNKELNKITTLGNVRSKIALTKDQKRLAFTDGESVTFLNLENYDRISFKGLGEVFAARFSQSVSMDSFEFSPDSTLFLYTFLNEAQKPFLAITDNNGNHIWRSEGHDKMIGEGKWIDNRRFVYRLSGKFRSSAEYYIATIPKREEWIDYSSINAVSKFIINSELIVSGREENQRGAFYTSVTPNMKRKELLFGLELDGFYHHYKYDLESKDLTQLTEGNCEDLGQMGDSISVSPDGSKFVYASNKTHRIQRQLFEYNLETDKEVQLTDFPVTNVGPEYSPCGKYLAFNHSSKKENGDLWVIDLKNSKKEQLSFSMPELLSAKLVESETITYKGALEWDIDAFLYKPKDLDKNKKYPAIVWVHGGPMRQMRGSWHPSATYSHFYAYNQFLVSQGYVVLSPNFRGGIGYGSEFRYGLYKKKGIDDTIDIVKAGEYLKNLDYVDEQKVAVYGLSYGGYMTLHSLTQYPESFAMGINIAGLWDIAQWGRWIRDTYGNYVGDANFCGMVEERPDLWAKGSPVFYKDNLNKPLMNLQGTKDPNVDFNQLNRIVKDCVELGVEHESVYYPDEMHTFRYRKTWKDALPRMNEFFAKYLLD
ncbi:MAG: alpha/beta fold hydrolase [Clostridia bacterium]